MLFDKDVQGQYRNIICALYVCNFVHIQPNNPDKQNAEQVNFIINLREENDNSMSNASSQDICYEINVKGGGESHSAVFFHSQHHYSPIFTYIHLYSYISY